MCVVQWHAWLHVPLCNVWPGGANGQLDVLQTFLMNNHNHGPTSDLAASGPCRAAV